MTVSIKTLSKMALLVCCVSFMLSVYNKPFMLSVVMLSVVMLNVITPFENSAWDHACNGWSNLLCWAVSFEHKMFMNQPLVSTIE